MRRAGSWNRSGAEVRKFGAAPPWARSGRHRALDEAAAEHAGLAGSRIVEHASLPGRDAVLAFEQIDFDAAGAGGEPRRLRRAGRTHLDENVPARERGFEIAVADPVHVAQQDLARGQRFARPDDDAAPFRIEPHDVERAARRDADAAALPDREMDDAVVPSQHAPVEVDDFARLGRAGTQALDHLGVAPGRNETA